MIKKLFGGKSQEFFLELNETGNNISTATKAEETQPAPAAVAQSEEKQSEATEVINAKPAKKSKKTSIKSKKKKATETTEPTPAPASASSNGASSGASSFEPPFWVKAMYNNNGSSNGKVEGGEKTFATDYLLPTSSSSRRRPGPSLNKFKEMARQAKTPRR